MSILFKNGYFLNGELQAVKGEVAVEGNVISYAGEQAPEAAYERVIDLKGNLLMPAFCNAHTHSAMTFLRSNSDGLPLDRWLHETVFPYEARLTADDVYLFTKLAVLEYVSGGTASCFDMYMFPEAVAAAAVDCGFRAVLCGALTDGDKTEKLEDNYNKFNNYSGLVSYRLGFHGEYTNSEPLLKDVAALAEKYKAPVFSHNSETAAEVEGCKERHGTTPTVYLDSLGMYNYGGGGFHCVHMTDEDIAVCRRRGLYAVTNPCSNAKLGSGIAPITRLLEGGAKLSVGTDGAASNNALDMFREIYLAAVLQRAEQRNAAAVPYKEVLKAALTGSAGAMGINSGKIAQGALADLTVIDMSLPNMQPVNDIAANLVFSGSRENVILTMVNGRVLYEKGEYFIGEEPEEIYRKAESAKKRLLC